MRKRQGSSAQSTAVAQPTAGRVAVYLRVSTDEQADSGLGLEAQRSRCRAMALVKGWPEPVEYADEGISGTKDATKRPALSRLLIAAEAGQLDAVIILDLSRLGRNTRLVLGLVETLTKQGVALVSAKESLDTTTPQGQFVLTLFAAVGQLERDMIAERTKSALAELSKRGGRAAGRLPYGYVYEGESVGEADAEVKTVRYIFGCRKRGDSLREIAAKLNAKSVPGPRGGVWHATSVREVLMNVDAYRGGRRGLSELRWPRVLA